MVGYILGSHVLEHYGGKIMYRGAAVIVFISLCLYLCTSKLFPSSVFSENPTNGFTIIDANQHENDEMELTELIDDVSENAVEFTSTASKNPSSTRKYIINTKIMDGTNRIER